MGRTDDHDRVTAMDLKVARRQWLDAMGTSAEPEAYQRMLSLVQRAKLEHGRSYARRLGAP